MKAVGLSAALMAEVERRCQTHPGLFDAVVAPHPLEHDVLEVPGFPCHAGVITLLSGPVPGDDVLGLDAMPEFQQQVTEQGEGLWSVALPVILQLLKTARGKADVLKDVHDG